MVCSLVSYARASVYPLPCPQELPNPEDLAENACCTALLFMRFSLDNHCADDCLALLGPLYQQPTKRFGMLQSCCRFTKDKTLQRPFLLAIRERNSKTCAFAVSRPIPSDGAGAFKPYTDANAARCKKDMHSRHSGNRFVREV